MVEMRSVHKILVEKPEGNTTWGQRHWCEDNIKIILKIRF